MKLIVLFFLLFSFMHADDLLQEESSYELGEGVKIGSLPLYLGGYFSLDYQQQNDEKRYRLDDIALLAYGSYSKFSYLTELEYKEFYTYTQDSNSTMVEQDTHLHIERLFVDYNYNENYMLKLGKFNSQVGFWNLLPINVLRDTSSNPLSTEIIFPRFTTGVYGAYTSYDSGELKFDLTLQNNDDLDANYNNYTIDKHYALGLTYSQDFLELKLNVGVFDNYIVNNTLQELYYFLASLQYETQDYKIMAEVGTQKSDERFITPYAGYIQGLYNITPKHAAIIRLESYEDRMTRLEDSFAIFAWTYRPLYPVAWKVSYQVHSMKSANKFLFSWSVLF
ncbi:hypothetical protein JHD47_03110 [Sulfurimonas sp. SAG-AH-194-L11]|nr:hypothetical protein [Sulfurimonas sp. SAG-AH-194-L11]MDF1876801.1 hypothetical protein [Sulfurimonas sp. SAG-AH-194-L11]